MHWPLVRLLVNSEIKTKNSTYQKNLPSPWPIKLTFRCFSVIIHQSLTLTYQTDSVIIHQSVTDDNKWLKPLRSISIARESLRHIFQGAKVFDLFKFTYRCQPVRTRLSFKNHNDFKFLRNTIMQEQDKPTATVKSHFKSIWLVTIVLTLITKIIFIQPKIQCFICFHQVLLCHWYGPINLSQYKDVLTSNSALASANLPLSHTSTRKTIPSTAGKYSFHTLLAANSKQKFYFLGKVHTRQQ